jgi:hypothetical protein
VPSGQLYERQVQRRLDGVTGETLMFIATPVE